VPLPAAATATTLAALSSPTGGATLLLTRDAATNLTSSLLWDSVNSQWRSVPPALPASLRAVLLGDISVSRAAWLVTASDGDGDGAAPTLYTWTNGGAPFFAPPANASVPACAAPLGALAALPSASALAALAAPPYSLALWEGGTGGRGCLGALDVLNNSAAPAAAAAPELRRVYALAYSFVSLTTYGVLAAAGPVGCEDGADCANATTSGLMLYAPVTPQAPDASLLAHGAWAAFPMPDGGGLNMVACLDDTFLTNATYCYALATWQPPPALYSGACDALTTGYALYAAQDNATSPGSAAAWTARGCVPLLPQALAIADFITLHVGGQDLSGSGGFRVVYSADGGVSWRALGRRVWKPGCKAEVIAHGAPPSCLESGRRTHFKSDNNDHGNDPYSFQA
jgi:hypothetical protein